MRTGMETHGNIQIRPFWALSFLRENHVVCNYAKDEKKHVRSYYAKGEKKHVRSYYAKGEKKHVRSYYAKGEKKHVQSYYAKGEKNLSSTHSSMDPSVLDQEVLEFDLYRYIIVLWYKLLHG
jgi:hypothetical protein